MLPAGTISRNDTFSDKRFADMQTDGLITEFIEELGKHSLYVFDIHGMNASCTPRVCLKRLPVSGKAFPLCCADITTLYGFELVKEHVETQNGISVGILGQR